VRRGERMSEIRAFAYSIPIHPRHSCVHADFQHMLAFTDKNKDLDTKEQIQAAIRQITVINDKIDKELGRLLNKLNLAVENQSNPRANSEHSDRDDGDIGMNEEKVEEQKGEHMTRAHASYLVLWGLKVSMYSHRLLEKLEYLPTSKRPAHAPTTKPDMRATWTRTRRVQSVLGSLSKGFARSSTTKRSRPNSSRGRRRSQACV
jgi:hypothetical protein